MAVTTVNLSDQMAAFVQKTNTISTHLGDINTLTTTADSSVVHAVNELETDVEQLKIDVANTTGSLSGYLTSNLDDVVTAGSIRFDDNIPLAFGNDSDLIISFDGSDAVINAVSGLQIKHNASNKLEILSGGATITGVMTSDSATINGNITVTGTVDGRDVATDGTKLDTIESNADVTDTANVTSAGALMRTGGNMTGNLTTNDNVSLNVGASNDLSIVHDTTNTIITNTTGELQIRGDTVKIQTQSGNEGIVMNSGGATTLAHNGSTKLTTTTTGVQASTFTGSLAGNASTASTLQTARTISLTGDVTGSVSFDGSQNVSLATTFTANNIVSADFASAVTLNIINSSGTTVKTLRSPGS